MSYVTQGAADLLPPATKKNAAQIATALRRAARQSRAPVMSITGGGGFRARKSDKIFWGSIILSFVLLVAIPFVTASVYYGLIASDQYVSEARMALRTGESSILDSFSGITGLPSSQQFQDTQIIANYVSSRAMIDKLESQLELRAMFSRGDSDWWASFNPARKAEDFEKYWRRQIDASIDQQSSIITLTVRAFKPEDAYVLVNKIIENSEELVNKFSEKARADAVRDARKDLTRAEERLTAASVAMRDDRNRLGVLSGEATAIAIEKVLGELRVSLAREQQDLAALTQNVKSDSPQARVATRRIESLASTIATYQSKLADTGKEGGSATLADRMEQLSKRQAELDIAQKLYASATVAYESARIDAETKHGYLLAFLKPTIPEKALYPRRWLGWMLVVIPAIILWSLLAGLGALVRDNMAS